MRPVVDGLQQTYAETTEFQMLNAAFGEGQAAFLAYALPGHPSYVILNSDGEMLWKGFGTMRADELESILRDQLGLTN